MGVRACRSRRPPSRISTDSPRKCWPRTSLRSMRMCIPMTFGPCSESVNEAFQLSSAWHNKFRYLHPVKGERWIEGWSSAQGRARWQRSLAWIRDGRHRPRASGGGQAGIRAVCPLGPRFALESHRRAGRVRAPSSPSTARGGCSRDANGAIGEVSEGANYLHVCDSATGEEREAATAFAAGIREVLAGQRASFELEYPCHSPSERRWFIGRVTPFPEGGPRRVVVAHQNITARKLAEEQLRDRERMLGPVAEDGPGRELGD